MQQEIVDLGSFNANVRDILQNSRNQLVENLEAQVIEVVSKLYDRGVVTDDEMSLTRSQNESGDQVKTLLTVMETKTVKELLVFAEILITIEGPLSVVGKQIIKTLGMRQSSFNCA